MTSHYPASDGESCRATSKCPPRWAESLLTHLLKPRDRESISGDLLEEYREERLPALGRARANLWYTRQILSLAFLQVLTGDPMKRSLISLCFFTLAASAWLGASETILRHPFFQMRIIWAVMLAAASLVTILYLVLPGYRLLRILVSLSAVFMINSGTGAIVALLGAAYFDGYILLIPAALILQLALAILTLAFVPDLSGFRLHL
jgi:hypothetical protein